MDNLAKKTFTPFYNKSGKYNSVIRSGKLEEIIDFFISLRENGKVNKEQWVTTQIKTSRNGKLYEELVEFEKKEEVMAKEHMPDREDDIPF
tara:strand:- start:5014 stop:5286 length:273 start_codon:yes stop_codon:yes gene_type:complete